MKRPARLILLALALALAAGLGWLLHESAQEPSTARPASASTLPPPPAPAAPSTTAPPGEQLLSEASLATQEEAEDAEPEEEATGPCIWVEVSARGAPVPGAHVAAILTDDDAFSEIEPLETLPDGHGVAFCDPGTYLLAASAPGFAPTVLKITEPSTGPAPRAHFELKPGHTLSGRVLSKDSQGSIPAARLVLSPEEGFSVQGAEDVLEKTVMTSDAQGAFRAADLAAGTYQLAVKAPGHVSKQTAVTLPRKEPLSIELDDTCRLEGEVVDATGAPVPGAKVWLNGRGRFADEKAPLTDAQGHFSLEVNGGTYLVGASAAGQTGLLDSAVTVVRGGLVDGLVIHLLPSGRISGKLFVQSTQAPVQNAMVIVRRAGMDWSRSAITDALGTFLVESLVPGQYTLELFKEGLPRMNREGLRVEAGQELSLELPATPESSIEGQITDGLGRPVQGAAVTVLRMDGAPTSGASHRAFSRSEGTYGVSGLGAGHYQLEARWNPNSKPLLRELTLQEGETLRADFAFPEMPGVVHGTVLRSSGGAPEESVAITATNEDPSLSTMENMDELGRFTLRLMPGTYTLKAEYADTEDSGPEQPITIEAAQRYAVQLTVPDSLTETSGTVLNSRGEPSPNAFVTLAGADLYGSGEADAQGHFSVKTSRTSAGAPVTLRARGEAEEGSSPEVRAGSQGTVIRLLKSAALHGRVSAAGGAPVQGFELSLRQKDPTLHSFLGNARPFAGDTFELVDLPLDELELLVRTRDGRCGKATLRLKPGETGTVEVSVGQLGRVTGRLVTVGGEPHRAHVSLDNTPLQGRGGSTASDGRFEFIALEPGPHVLTLETQQAFPFTLRAGEALDLGDLKEPP